MVNVGDGLTDGAFIKDRLLVNQARHESGRADLVDAAGKAFGVFKDTLKGIVVEIPSSRHLIQYAYQWPLEKAVEQSVKATSLAKELGLYTAFFTIDASREDLDWLLALMEKAATNGHMESLVLVDTMGVCTPQAIEYFVRKTKERINKPLEAHFHNDFGLAVANTLTALACGVEVAHTAICGTGERSRSAALEDVIVALLTLYGIDLGMRCDKLYELAQLTAELTGHRLPQNKSIVGDKLFNMKVSDQEVDRLLVLVKDKAMEKKDLLNEEEFRDLARQVLAGSQ